MTAQSLQPGQTVRVKDGVAAPDQLEIDIGGWYARVRGVVFREEGTDRPLVMIEWDALTLRALPEPYLDHAAAHSLMPHCMTLYTDEVEPAEPRDTPLDAWIARGEMDLPGTWLHAGETGRRIMETVADARFALDPEAAAYEVWENALRERMRFPFQASIADDTPEDWLMHTGDTLKLTGVDSWVEEHGVLANVVPEDREDDGYTFPISYLEHLNADEATEIALVDYRSWFKYHEAPEMLLGVSGILEEFADAVSAGMLPTDALEQATMRKREFAPHLLNVLANVRDNLDEIVADPDDDRHWHFLFVTYLLAYWQEPRVHAILCDILHGPADKVSGLINDGIIGDLGRILASTCFESEDTSRIEALIRDDNAHDLIRCEALRAWLILVICGVKTRADVLAFFTRLFEDELTRTPGEVWGELALCCAHLHLTELRPAIARAFAEDLAPKGFINETDVDEVFAMPQEEAIDNAFGGESPFIVEPVEELRDWACFGDTHDFLFGDALTGDDFVDPEDSWLPPAPREPASAPEPIRRKEPKVGRNDPCSCGSGKKYKKCCGRG